MKTGRKCKVCAPENCGTHYLYMAYDSQRALTKIGLTKSISGRRKNYRANGNTHIDILYYKPAGCWFVASDREDRAINRLPKEKQVRGDWFDVDDLIAIEAIRHATRNLRTEEVFCEVIS